MIFTMIQSAAAGGYRYLLDEFGTDIRCAWALNLLASGYAGNCIRVRESGGNTEADIGFDGDWLDETALLAHCGSNDGYIVTWYDQSGNARNKTNATTTQQPRIVAAGVVDTVNGHPAAYYSTSADKWLTLASNPTDATVQYYGVWKLTADQTIAIGRDDNSGYFGFYSLNGNASAPQNVLGTPTYYSNGSALGSTRDDLYDAYFNNQRLVAARSFSFATLSSFNDSYKHGGGNAFKGYRQLDVYYGSHTEAQADIEGLINENYAIF